MSKVATIQEQLLRVDDLIAQLERDTFHVPNPKPSLLANIRALEKERRNLQSEFETAAAQAELDIYRYRILNRDRATIEGLTDAWRGFQHLLSSVYDSLLHGGAPKKVRRGKAKTQEPPVHQLELGFAYSFPGSVGVALTLPSRTSGLFADDKIREATETIFDFAESHADISTVHSMVRKLGPVPVAAMYRWVETHVVHHYGVQIEWKRTDQEPRTMLCQFEQLEVLRAELSRATIETILNVNGDLSAVDMDEFAFRITTDDGEKIEGQFSDAISPEHRANLPGRYAATIIKETKIVEGPNGEQEVTYSLQKIEPL